MIEKHAKYIDIPVLTMILKSIHVIVGFPNASFITKVVKDHIEDFPHTRTVELTTLLGLVMDILLNTSKGASRAGQSDEDSLLAQTICNNSYHVFKTISSG